MSKRENTTIYSVAQAAHRLGVSRASIYQRIAVGVIQVVENQFPLRITSAILATYCAWRRKGRYGSPPRTGEYTLHDAARRLRLSYQKTRLLILAGELSGEKRTGRWYVRL